MQAIRPFLTALPLLLGTSFAPAATGVVTPGAPPVRVLTPLESSVVDGLSPVPQADLNLQPSATVSIRVKDKSPVRKVQRSGLGLPAAVYAGDPFEVAPLLPLSPQARAPAPIDFMNDGDSAEAWATMSATGVPHLRLRGFGDFQADATAAWTSRFSLGGSTSKEVVLRFVVPPTVVSGDTEGEGPAWWRSRMRTDVLVNGFPAWSTEAWRLRADYTQTSIQGIPVMHPLNVLQTFGDPLPFPTDDEDTPPQQGGPANDSAVGNMEMASSPRVVYLSLGRYNPGQAIELSLVVRGTAFTRPSPGLTQDHRCQWNGVRYFCSRASMSVDGRGIEAPRVTLMP